MKLNASTVEILSNFAKINQSILLKQGDFISTKSTNNIIYAEAFLDDPIDLDAGIYNLPQLLSLNAMVTDASITADTATRSLMVTDGSRKFKIRLADPSTIIAPKKRLNFPVADVIFDLPWARIDEVKKAGAVLGLDTICFTNVDDKISIKLVASNATSDESDSGQIPVGEYHNVDGNEVDADFEFYTSLSNFRFIEGDYKVLISKMGVVKFEGQTANKISYIMSLDSNSKYTERS